VSSAAEDTCEHLRSILAKALIAQDQLVFSLPVDDRDEPGELVVQVVAELEVLLARLEETDPLLSLVVRHLRC